MRHEARSIVTLSGHVPPVTHVRGTLVASSLSSMRTHGRQESYFRALPEAHHDAIRDLLPRSWLPVEMAVAHYRAMDALGFAHEQCRQNGRSVAGRVQQSYLGTIVRSLKATRTLSVWTLLERFPTAWARMFQGGGPAVFQLGPKEARIACHGLPLAQIAYFRAGWEGTFDSALELICRKAYVREIPEMRRPDRVVFRASWV